MVDLTKEEIDDLLANLDTFSEAEQRDIYDLLTQFEERKVSEVARNDLIQFCLAMQPDYLVGKHHKRLAELLEDVEKGEKDRISVSIAPRHGKSTLGTILYAAWFIGRNPNKKIMLVSHTADLAVDFGRKIRNLVATPAYQKIFPGVALAQDSKSAGRWNTNRGGEFFACGVGSALAGRGADLLLVDDPHSEQDILNGNFEIFEKAYQWFTYGARTRLMPGGRVVIIATRWHLDDLIGRVVRDAKQNPGADQYEVFEFPAILEVDRVDPETGVVKKVERALWPEFFKLEELQRTRETMPTFQWNAQYQQNPTSEEGAIIKREYWKQWTRETPPECEFIIMALDAAAEAHNRADFTALTTWGIFFNEETNQHNIILLNSIKTRVEFPELKKLAFEQYNEFNPDTFIVEKKSSGTPLYQELRRTGMSVTEYTPVRGTANNPNTKMARLNSVADIVKSGICWVPQTRWAEELVEEVASFPFGSHDDLVDTLIMALLRFRQGGFVRLPTDEPEEERYFKRRSGGYY